MKASISTIPKTYQSEIIIKSDEDIILLRNYCVSTDKVKSEYKVLFDTFNELNSEDSRYAKRILEKGGDVEKIKQYLQGEKDKRAIIKSDNLKYVKI